MSAVWTTIAGLTVVTVAIKAAGPVALGGRDLLVGATLAQYPCWVIGTAIGALGGGLLDDPRTLGLDAIFPAFFLALMWDDLRDRRALLVAAAAAVLALALVPFTPAGVPVIAACVPAIVGARWR